MSAVTTAAGSSSGPLAQSRMSQFVAAVGGTGRGSFAALAANAEPSVGTNPSGLVLGDVDGDGDLDFLSSSYFNGTVSLRLTNGRGSFVAPAASAEIAVGATPAGVALGDVDGDGDLDLLAGNVNGGTVSVRLNNGRGSFSGGSDPAVGDYPSSLALGDMDGDGDLDIASADLSGNVVRVRFNDGMGAFTARATTPDVAAGSSLKAVVLGDVDADGDLDLLIVGAIGTVSTRLNTGSGSFTIPTTNATVAVGSGSATIASGDIDGDGDLDVLTTSALNNTVSIRLNGGTVLAASARRELAGQGAFFPNPARTTVTAQLPAIGGATEATLAFRDALGRVVRTQQLHLNAIGTTAELSLTGLVPGLYQVQIQAGGQCLNGRLAVE